MAETIYKSECCGADVRTEGVPDFLGSREVCTVNFACLKCGKPCDVMAAAIVDSAEKKESQV